MRLIKRLLSVFSKPKPVETIQQEYIHKTKKIDRTEVLRLIEANGGANGLDLSQYDLSGANLANLKLDGIIFGTHKTIRFQGAEIIQTYGTNLEGTWFERSTLKNAQFGRANLRNARFYLTDLTCANFWMADASGAHFTRANLIDTNFHGAKLMGANFQVANLTNANLQDANLENAMISKTAIGKGILQEKTEEIERHFSQWYISPEVREKYLQQKIRDRFTDSANIYRELKKAFSASGFYNDESWAYRKERKMRKRITFQSIGSDIRNRNLLSAVLNLIKWLGDWIVELLCDYGESVWRVFIWLFLIIFVIGPLVVELSGGLNWVGENAQVYFSLPTDLHRALYSYFQHVLYLVDVLATTSFAEVEPKTDIVRFASGILSMFGIFLLGLLGFVAGNVIRHR